MRTLWLHGMGGKPNEEKIARMRELGLEMHALHLNYSQTPNSFEVLRDYCKEHQIEFLTGSSHGGFFAFWLSEELGIPCLLLNPALSIRAKRRTKPNVSQEISRLNLLALGKEDNVIDHTRTVLYMEKDKPDHPDKTVKIKIVENEGHGFSMSAFDEILDWAMNELSDFQKNKIE